MSEIDGVDVAALREKYREAYFGTLHKMTATLRHKPNVAYGVAESNGIRAVLAALRADPELAAAALGAEHAISAWRVKGPGDEWFRGTKEQAMRHGGQRGAYFRLPWIDVRPDGSDDEVTP